MFTVSHPYVVPAIAIFGLIPGIVGSTKLSPRLIDEKAAITELMFGLYWVRDVPINDVTEVASITPVTTGTAVVTTKQPSNPNPTPPVVTTPIATGAASSPPAPSISIAQETVVREPSNPDAWISLGTAYKNEARLDNALKAFNEAIRLKPSSALALYGLGETYHLMGNREKVGEVYQRISAINKVVADRFFKAFILP